MVINTQAKHINTTDMEEDSIFQEIKGMSDNSVEMIFMVKEFSMMPKIMCFTMVYGEEENNKKSYDFFTLYFQFFMKDKIYAD